MASPIDPEILTTATAEEIIDLLKTGKYSILKTFKAKKMRLSALVLGIFCKIAVFFVFYDQILRIDTLRKNKPTKQTFKRRAAKLIIFLFRIQFIDHFEHKPADQAAIFYYNHWSYSEPIIQLAYYFLNFPDEPCTLPVNALQFEGLALINNWLTILDVKIYPVITKSTHRKLKKVNHKHTDPKAYKKLILSIAGKFAQYSRTYGVIAPIDNCQFFSFALNPTRTPPHIFPNKAAYEGSDRKALGNMPAVMDIFRSAINDHSRERGANVVVVAFTVDLIGRVGKLFNFFRRHIVTIGEPEPLHSLPHLPRKASEHCYRQLTKHLSPCRRYPLEKRNI